METREKTKLYLIGSCASEICGAKLPSNKQVLGLFLHRHLSEKQTTRTAATGVIQEVKTFWDKAHLPVRASQHSINKLEKLFEDWRILKKHKDRTTDHHKEQEAEFIDKMEDLFDIAHADALEIIKIPDDRDFLLAQREKGRRGIMGSVDKVLDAKVKRAKKRAVTEEKRRLKAHAEKDMANEGAGLTSFSRTSSATASGESTDTADTADELKGAVTATPSRPKRAKKNIITAGLAAALDRTGISSRDATYVLAEAAASLGHDVADVNINRMSIHRHRQLHRARFAHNLKDTYTVDVPLVVHWDGKMMEDLTTKEHVDRLPVIISGVGVCQLLGVPKISSGTGEAQASAVMNCLEDWGLSDRVKAMCFDTTSANTGNKTGACRLLENTLKHDVLYLACRHHVLELLVSAAFEKTMGATSGPEVLIFKRFREQWRFIDQDNFQPSHSDEYVRNIMSPLRDSLLDFARKQLEERQCRDDYREFLELSVIFLGEVPSRGVKFMAPGAMHHARWMAKVLYAIKIWMYRSQFKLTVREETGLRDIAIFAVQLYLKAWMMAPLAAAAPYNDFQLMNQLLQYSHIQPDISKATAKKMAHHLWYLSEELVGLALFDENVSSSVKRLMVEALNTQGTERPAKRPEIDLKVFGDHSKTLEQFVTTNTMTLFQLLNMPSGFLSTDPETWKDNAEYKAASTVVSGLKVVNDNAERGVSLVQEFNKKLTKDEEQLQFLLQVVADHRRVYPTSLKRTLTTDRQQ
jgi:hypothetical protein